MIRLLLILLLIPSISWAACDCGSTDSGSPCTGQSISVTVIAGTPNGGTAIDNVFNWSFTSGSGDARCGQFANGDYWIVPASGQTTVELNSITTTNTGGLTADVDPVMESLGLLDGSNNYGNYNSSENIIPNLPQSYSGINSIVAAIQRDETTEGPCGTSQILGECVDSYMVVTILSSVPENAGSTVIRPNITGSSKEILTLADFDFTRLPSKSYLTGTDTAGIEAMRARWSHSTEAFGLIDHNNGDAGYSEGGRAYRSHILIDDYGAGTAVSLYSALMTLFSDDNTLTEKTPALAAILSYGLDLYHAHEDVTNRYWGAGAAQSPGKFIAPALLAALLIDTTKYTALSDTVSHIYDGPQVGPHELAQVQQGNNGLIWGGISDSSQAAEVFGEYWGRVLVGGCHDGVPLETCNTTSGTRTARDPHHYIDGPQNRPGSGYMSNALGPQRAFLAVEALIPQLRNMLNSDDLYDYVTRVATDGAFASPDPCVTPDSREATDGSCSPYPSGGGCTYYGVTWGPVDKDSLSSDCIKADTNASVIAAVSGGYVNVGRFDERWDGTTINPTYTTAQVENNAATIFAEYGVESGGGGSSSLRRWISSSGTLLYTNGTARVTQ